MKLVIFENIQILQKAGSSLKRETVLFDDGVIKNLGSTVLQHETRLKLKLKN